MATVGQRITAARIKARLSQQALAAKVGTTRSWVASVETGRTVQPKPEKLRAVADELGLDYRELLAITNQLGAVAAQQEQQGDLAAALRELVEEVRLSRLSSERNADVLAQLLGVVLAGRLPQPGTEAEVGAPSEQGTR